MRAAVLHTHGEPPRFGSHPDPRPSPGEGLLRVTAAPLVPLDLLCASGSSYFGAPALPYVPGVQGVGVVEQAETFEPGTRVWFATSAGMAPGDGSLAELAAVPEHDLVAVDAPVTDHALAALGLSAVAAWMSLTWRARMRPGERVLVLGGGGAVGQSAIGAARLLGAGQVVAVCRSREAAARAAAAGADEIAVVGQLAGEGPSDLVDLLRDTCAGEVDVVVDPVFGPLAEAAAQLLAPGGRLVNLGSSAGEQATFSSALVRSRSLEILGYSNNSLSAEQRRAAVVAIAGHAAVGDLAVAHEVHPLAAISEVWQALASGDARARLVLAP